MRVYTPEELKAFLQGVDDALEQAADVIVIGGAAAAVQYGVALGTRDIDTWSSVHEDLARAVQRARDVTGLVVPFQQSGVADGPMDFESRLERTLPHLRRLRVEVPEKHDLVLMKVIRGYEHDLLAIEALHRESALDLDVILQRYQAEMGAVITDPRRLRDNLLALVERLFPERAEAIGKQLKPPAPALWRLGPARRPPDRSGGPER